MLGSLIPHRELKLWNRPPDHLLLAEDEIHLWLVDLEEFELQGDPARLLSTEERHRSERLVVPEKRNTFINSRAALRLIIARYLDINPADICFKVSETGKPFLSDAVSAPGLNFNLAHSGRWMILGICEGADLGVDIEEVRKINWNWALEKLFSKEERDRFLMLPEKDRAKAFINIWVEKEAVAKADGTGLVGVPTSIDSLHSTKQEVIDEIYMTFRKDPYWIIKFEAVPEFLAAAAVCSLKKPGISFYSFSYDLASMDLNAFGCNFSSPERVKEKELANK